MKLYALIITPFVMTTVSSASLPNTGTRVGSGLNVRQHSPQLGPEPPILPRDADSNTIEPGALKKIFLEIPLVQRLETGVREALEAMPDAVFDRLATLTGDKFYAYMDTLLDGKVPG
ncbi:hypothetical protein TWF281_002111 [Arthrobotrys megalospora]